MSADKTVKRLNTLARGSLALCLILAAAILLPGHWSGMEFRAEVLRGGVASLPLAALLLCLSACLATLQVAQARMVDPQGLSVGRAARWPQLLVPLLALPAAVLAWRLRPGVMPPAGPAETGYVLGGLAIALAFVLLVAERSLAATPEAVLPEAPRLRALAFLATGAIAGTGALEILANLGLPFTGQAGIGVALVLVATSVELAVRAAGRIFLPPPDAAVARAAVDSIIARLICAGVAAPGGVSAPLRQHLGIDFSRSWALAFIRAAALPMVGFLGLLAWGLSGVVLVPVDGRAIYERFGAPVRVLHPGLHLGLPWPLGTARAVEYGPVHAIGLTDAAKTVADIAGPEDLAPASADRLWEQAHPAEVELLIASNTNNRQSFQSVSADLRILYRVGLNDASALHAAYSVAAPEDLVRANAGRVVAGYFATRTLDDVLGANRETMAEMMRGRLQTAVDAANSGLDVVAVVIEAIHPPAGAADAYHNVRAAEIAAQASIAVEHGAAATIYAQSRQYAYDQTSNARATAAETVNTAQTQQIRFTADQDAARAGGQAFLLERYFAALAAALGKSPKTIIDHRLNWPEAPVLDLRPMAATAGLGTGKEE